MSLKGFYKTDVVTVAADKSVIEAADIMRQRNVGDVVVVDEKGGARKPVGLLTDRDIVIGCIANGGSDVHTTKVSEVMSQDPVCCYETEGVYEVVQKMRQEGVGRMPIVDEKNNLIGIITSKNILALLSDELTELVSISDAQKEAAKNSKHGTRTSARPESQSTTMTQ